MAAGPPPPGPRPEWLEHAHTPAARIAIQRWLATHPAPGRATPPPRPAARLRRRPPGRPAAADAAAGADPSPSPVRDAVVDLPGAAVRLAGCCTPVPPDEVTGFAVRGGSGHRAPRRVRRAWRAWRTRGATEVGVRWGDTTGCRVTLLAESFGRPHLLADLTEAIAAEGADIVSATVEPPSQQRVRHTYTVQLPDAARLPTLMRAMRNVPGVYDVGRAQHHADGRPPATTGRSAARALHHPFEWAGCASPTRRARPLVAVVHAAHPPRAGCQSALLASAVSVCLVAASAPGGRAARRRRPPLPEPRQPRLRRRVVRPRPSPTPATTTSRSRPSPRSTPGPPHALDRINLDFAHGKVRLGRGRRQRRPRSPALARTWCHPAGHARRGQRMRITVRHTSDPVTSGDRDGGWVRTKDGLAMANQADAAHLVFPCNDHPSDKAMFTFRVTAPDGLHRRRQRAARPACREGRRDDHLDVPHRSTPWPPSSPRCPSAAPPSLHRRGRTRCRCATSCPPRTAPSLEPWLKKTPEQIAWMERQGRPLPLRDLRAARWPTPHTGFELETQTLSLFERGPLHRARLPRVVRRVDHGARAGPPVVRRQRLPAHLVRPVAQRGPRHLVRGAVRRGEGGPHPGEAHEGGLRRLRRAGAPPAARPPRPRRPSAGQKISIFRPNVYDGAALVLYALRQEIGRAPSSAWSGPGSPATGTATATTADFVAPRLRDRRT